MTSIRSLLLCVGFAGLTLSQSACQKQNDAVEKKLDYLIGKVEGLEKKVGQGGGGARGAGQGQMPERKKPSPTAVYSVDVAGAPFKGPADAKITVVKAFEFACPYCQKVIPTTDQLLKDYEGKIRLVEMQYVVHPDRATKPALAACAAQQQGKYEEYKGLLWEKGFANMGSGGFSDENLVKYAEEAKLEVGKFKSDLDGEVCKKKVQSEQARLAAVGTTGTPAFYINGRFLSGARPVDQFKAIIDEELAKADAALAKGGVTAQNYYQKTVVEAGVKKFE